MSNYVFLGKRLKVLNDTPLENDSGKYIGSCSIQLTEPKLILDNVLDIKHTSIFNIYEKVIHITTMDAVLACRRVNNLFMRKYKVPLYERNFKIFNKFKIPRIKVSSISYEYIPIIEAYASRLMKHSITEEYVPVILKDAVMNRISYNN